MVQNNQDYIISAFNRLNGALKELDSENEIIVLDFSHFSPLDDGKNNIYLRFVAKNENYAKKYSSYVDGLIATSSGKWKKFKENTVRKLYNFNNKINSFREEIEIKEFPKKVILGENVLPDFEPNQHLIPEFKTKEILPGNCFIIYAESHDYAQSIVYILLKNRLETGDCDTKDLEKSPLENFDAFDKELHALLIHEMIKSLIEEKTDSYKQTQIAATRAANLSILVDSFAHNVGAHSLSALSNYYAGRKANLEKRTIKKNILYDNTPINAILEHEIKNLFTTYVGPAYKQLLGNDISEGDKDKVSLSDIMQYDNVDLRKRLLHFTQTNMNDTVKEIHIPVPIDDSVYSFINYLSEKSEFWSAVVAGETFNNTFSNVYELLWGFINNPLFIGTLAASEKIYKVKFKINSKEFASVDFSAIEAKDLSGDYQFIKLLNNFEELRACLSAKNILLPGANVGKQSVYTIFENCLRNIKHYNISGWNGEVVFHLDIKENPNDFLIETYLGHSSYLNQKLCANIVADIDKQIKKGVYDTIKNQPIMGGTSQSILCANQIATGIFSDDETKYFSVNCENDHVKYSFKAWKAEIVKDVTTPSNLCGADDNIFRYKFLSTSKKENLNTIKEKAGDAIRIIETTTSDKDILYCQWLQFWLGPGNYDWRNPFNENRIKLNDRLEFSHGVESEDMLTFRNHGIFKTSIKPRWGEMKYDVAEAMLTGIYAIDNRLHNVIKQKKNIGIIEDKLCLHIKEETETLFVNNKVVSLIGDNFYIDNKIHFLIIHLSFLESLDNSCYKEDINKFIAKVKKAVNGRENFHLVITTGRGRIDWKVAISDTHKYFCKYRSVVSMQNALLDGVMKGDDFNLKYNLAKVLFGS